MTRKVKYITIATVLAIVTALTSLICGLLYIENSRAETLTRLESEYKNNLYTLSESVNTAQTNLAKIMVSASNGESGMLSAQNHRAAAQASSALSALPVSREKTEGALKFLNQLSDWSYSMTTAALKGKDLAKYREQAEELLTAVTRLKIKIDDVLVRVSDSTIVKNISDSLSFSFDAGEEQIEPYEEYPSLIYDGPYSDAEQKQSFTKLDFLKEISESQAKQVVEKYGFTSPEKYGEGDEPRSYIFSCRYEGKEAMVTVSRKGGIILLADVFVDTENESPQERFAIEAAQKFASKFGYESVTPVWYNESGGEAVINFARKEGGVICYTDLVKIKVTASGEFSGIEATGYCGAHDKKQLTPVLTATEATAKVSPLLTVKNVRLVVIPDGHSERLCFEVVAVYKGATYFVYIDATDGSEAEILQTVELPGQGKMVV